MGMFNNIKHGIPKSDLIQKTKVMGSFEKKNSSEWEDEVLGDLYDKLEHTCLPNAVKNSAQKVADKSKENQESSIRKLGAVSCGNLVSSISSRKMGTRELMSEFDTGTNISDMYPIYLIRGRGSVRPKKAPILAWTRRCGKFFGYHMYSSPSKPKNYMILSYFKTINEIPEIVEGECQSAFGKL